MIPLSDAYLLAKGRGVLPSAAAAFAAMAAAMPDIIAYAEARAAAAV